MGTKEKTKQMQINLMKQGFPKWQAKIVDDCRKIYCYLARNGPVQRMIVKERLAQAGFSILIRYESLHLSEVA